MNNSGSWALSDRANTTTTDSARALDFTTQYESAVVYERNLQDMYDNSISELKDLQSKARERAPYNTNLCTMNPMYPTWNAKQPCYNNKSCDLNMHPVCQGGTDCNPMNSFYAGNNMNGMNMNGMNYHMSMPMSMHVAHYGDDEEDCDEEEDTDEEVEVEVEIECMEKPDKSSKKIKPMKRMSRNMMRALMGVAYDFNHWNQLPPQKNRLSTGNTFKYVLGRDNRPLYIVMLVAFLVFVIAVLVGIACVVKKSQHHHKRNKVLRDLKENAYIQYQMQGLNRPSYYSPTPSAPPYASKNSLMAGSVRKW